MLGRFSLRRIWPASQITILLGKMVDLAGGPARATFWGLSGLLGQFWLKNGSKSGILGGPKNGLFLGL